MTKIRPLETMILMFVLALLAGLGALALLGSAQTTTLPAVHQQVNVHTNSHAVERHGTDAYRARLAVFNCDPKYLQMFVHDSTLNNPASQGKWLFVCPNTSGHQCAGMIVGTTAQSDGSYPEFTAYVSTCEYWTCTVPTRDGYIWAPAAVIKDAWTALLAAEVCDENNQD